MKHEGGLTAKPSRGTRRRKINLLLTCPMCHLIKLIARGSSGENDGLPLQDPFSKGSRACQTHGMPSGEEMSGEIFCQELARLPRVLSG